MIYTCSYKNFNTNLLKGISISGDRGKSVDFSGQAYPSLAPKKEFLKIWHNNIGRISDEENNRYYIEEYYKQVLSHLDPLKVFRDLDYTTLLCYEDTNDFCHRHIVAAWFKLFLDFDVKEVKVKGLYVEELEINNEIINILENVIKENANLHGFNNIRAFYIFHKSELLEQRANLLEEKYPNKCYDNLRQSAAYLRSEADNLEEQYILKLRKK